LATGLGFNGAFSAGFRSVDFSAGLILSSFLTSAVLPSGYFESGAADFFPGTSFLSSGLSVRGYFCLGTSIFSTFFGSSIFFSGDADFFACLGSA
jgi:hypothetical protein